MLFTSLCFQHKTLIAIYQTGDDEDATQIDEESRIAEVSHNVDCLDSEDDTASLDDVTDSAQDVTGDPPAKKGKEEAVK